MDNYDKWYKSSSAFHEKRWKDHAIQRAMQKAFFGAGQIYKKEITQLKEELKKLKEFSNKTIGHGIDSAVKGDKQIAQLKEDIEIINNLLLREVTSTYYLHEEIDQLQE